MGDDLKRLEKQELARRKNLAEWRASRLHELTLPSGLEVVVRDISMTDIMFAGRLPDAVLALADEAAKAGEKTIDLRKMAELAPEVAPLYDLTAKMALVSPQIGPEPDDTHITLGELSADDKQAILDFVNREAPKLRPFREGEDEPVEAVQPGDGLRAEAEQLPGSGNGSRGLAAR